MGVCQKWRRMVDHLLQLAHTQVLFSSCLPLFSSAREGEPNYDEFLIVRKSVKASSDQKKFERFPPFAISTFICKNFHLIRLMDGKCFFAGELGVAGERAARILLCIELSNFHCRNWMGND